MVAAKRTVVVIHRLPTRRSAAHPPDPVRVLDPNHPPNRIGHGVVVAAAAVVAVPGPNLRRECVPINHLRHLRGRRRKSMLRRLIRRDGVITTRIRSWRRRN